MHSTLTPVASALTFMSLFSSIQAGLLPNLQPRAPLTCVNDDYLLAIATAIPSFDSTPFCSSWLDITDTTSYYSTVTPRSTAYAGTSIIATTTDTVTSYDSTVTVTATTVNLVPKKKKRDAVPEPVITPRATLDDIVPVLAPRADSSEVDSIVSGISSACSCLRLTPGVIFEITTLSSTAVRTEDVDVYDTQTVFQTTTAGTTTVTVTVATTEHLSTILTNSSTASSTISPTLIISSSNATTTTGSPTSTTATTSPSPTASGCPAINGTRISSDQTCKQYVAQCYIDYPVTNDLYSLASRVDTPEDCAATCDQGNTVDTPCYGFVFDNPSVAQGYNCFGLGSLDGPFSVPPTQNVVTYIQVNSTDPSCLPKNTTTTTALPSTTFSSNLSSITTSPSLTISNSANSTQTRVYNTTTHHHHHNKTTTASATPTNSYNSTTASLTPTNSYNQTSTTGCPAQVTITQNYTITSISALTVTVTSMESHQPRWRNHKSN